MENERRTFEPLTGVCLTSRRAKLSARMLLISSPETDQSMRLHPGELRRSRPACFGKPYQDKRRPLEASCPLDPGFKRSTPTCALKLRGEKKGHKGSTPSWSHPPQITISTRHLRAEPSRWRENQPKKGRAGKTSAGAARAACWSYCADLRSSSQQNGCSQNRIGLSRTRTVPQPSALGEFSNSHYGRCRVEHLAGPCLVCRTPHYSHFDARRAVKTSEFRQGRENRALVSGCLHTWRQGPHLFSNTSKKKEEPVILPLLI